MPLEKDMTEYKGVKKAESNPPAVPSKPSLDDNNRF